MAVRASMAGAAALVALVGCTANPYLPERKFGEVSELRLMRLAGSRIPRMVDPNDARPLTTSPLTIITRDQINHYGANSLSELVGFYSFDYSGAGR